MALTLTELQDGIAFWNTKTKWNRNDTFHQKFYQDMAQVNPQGSFTPQWWQGFLDVLWNWRACRTSVVGRDKAWYVTQGNLALDKLSAAWQQVAGIGPDADVSSVVWPQILDLPTEAAKIKGATSPVFASKFCHFLAPHIYPVVDNEAMGNPTATYKQYVEFVQSDWQETSNRMRATLAGHLGWHLGTPPDEGYPMTNKLVELCLTGRHHPRGGAVTASTGSPG